MHQKARQAMCISFGVAMNLRCSAKINVHTVQCTDQHVYAASELGAPLLQSELDQAHLLLLVLTPMMQGDQC